MSAQLPTAFQHQIRALYPTESEFFLESLTHSSFTSIRYNPFKSSPKFAVQHQVPWCANGYYLENRPEFIFDPLHHAGAYYVQESSSMFLEQVFLQLYKQTNLPLTVLDLCAAPGGKSTIISSLLKPNDVLVSNEVIKQRVSILEENISKWGQPNTIITQNDPKDFAALTHFFDCIVIDAPCSGEGLFRRDTDAINEWSEANIELCKARQQRIVGSVMNALKPGGFLIYSTCTYNKAENEDNVKWMMQQYHLKGIEIAIETQWNITSSLDEEVVGYRFLPHKTKGEGLFMACLQKPIDQDKQYSHSVKKFKSQFKPSEIVSLKQWLNDADAFDFISVGDSIHAIPKSLTERLGVLGKYLYIKSAGIRLGTLAHQQLIPDHQLALSSKLHHHINRIELGLDDAIRYLRKDTLSLPQAPLGWAALSYKQLPIGWAKVLHNRVNNYLPLSLRIIKEYAYQN